MAACQTSNPDDLFGTNQSTTTTPSDQQASLTNPTGTNPNARTKLANTRNALSDYCPTVRIHAGTETFRLYKGKDRSKADNLRYQATLTKVARECSYVGENLEIRVGALGRVISGPAGGAGSFKMPIRVAVQEGSCSRHFELHQLPANVTSGASFAKFEFVDETIVIPAPKATNVRIYLGFDETPSAKPTAKSCET
ncbi:MAG: hypothetical protein ACR2O8_03630 [Rhizobiaceae bacterium]